MAQKFTSLDEAVSLLGITKDRLNQLREAQIVRGYRDGTSWKFRAEDIEKLAAEGIPEIEPEPSDLSLDLDEPLDFDLDLDDEATTVAAEPTPAPPAPAAASSESPPASGLDLDLDLADDDETELASPPSDLNLEDIDEPTVAADADDELTVDADEEPSDVLSLDDDETISLSDSILLSESELGITSKRPPSTIIGKAELDLGSDLDLALSDDDKPGSDLKMAPGSDILSAAPGDDLELEMELPSPSGEFEGLPEIDIDLEAESSRILAPEDVAKAKGAAASAAAASAAAAMSDLELAPTESDARVGASNINLGGESEVGSGLTGLSALELEDDDQVLGEGSDVTLASESSGINIISPSDSGLALDEVALDLAGSSPIGSSLDLGNVSDVAVAGSGISGLGLDIGGTSQIGEDFQLTPIGEDTDEDDKDSSQVIALDEVAEEEAVGSPLGMGDSQILTEDFGAVGGLAPGAVTVVDATDTSFSTANVAMLSCCMLLLAGCGMMAYDLVRNMWIWSDVTAPSSFLLEAVNPFIK